MLRALKQASKAYGADEVPVGAVIVDSKTNQVIAQAYNLTIKNSDPLSHAEITAIRKAAKSRGSPYLSECDLYVTLEPCPMCAYAISLAKIRRLYFGAFDKKTGGVENGPRIFSNSCAHHKPEIYGGIMEKEAKEMLQNFFRELRDKDRST